MRLSLLAQAWISVAQIVCRAPVGAWIETTNQQTNMKQFVEEILWGMIENFYEAFLLFQKETQEYEKKLDHFSKTKNIAKPELVENLSVEEVLSLVNLDNIQALKETYLSPLIQMATQFQQISYKNDLFANYIRDFYHEIAILQSELYKLNSNAPEWMEIKALPKYQSFLGGYICLPSKIYQLSHKLETAQKELMKVVSFYKENDLLVRSLVMFGEETIGSISKNAFFDFVKRVYSQGYLLELYTRAAYSFLESGFHDYAESATQKGRFILDNEKYNGSEFWKNKWEIVANVILPSPKTLRPELESR